MSLSGNICSGSPFQWCPLEAFQCLHICCLQKRKILLTYSAAGEVPVLDEYWVENVLLGGRKRWWITVKAYFLTNLPVYFVIWNYNEDVSSLISWANWMGSEMKLGDDGSSGLVFAGSLFPVAPGWGRGSHAWVFWEQGKINLIYLVPACDVVSEKTNEPAVFSAVFIGD